MPLYGHELTAGTFPSQAGLGRVVVLDKPGDFVGRSAIEQGAPQDARVLVGLQGTGKRAARAGYDLHVRASEEGAPVGEITSGALSPTLGHPIALAYVDPQYAEAGTELDVDVRGSRIPFTVTTLPFYSRKKN